MSKLLGWAGGVITFFYLSGWGFLVYNRSNTLIGMDLNAIGDFLGGSFGPLAFLWLVLGFFQQGIELRINSDALKLQAAEVQAAAQHASGLLDVAKKEHELELKKLERDIEHERTQRERQESERAAADTDRARRAEAARVRKLQPDFRFMPGARDGDKWIVDMTNDGQSCSDVAVQITQQLDYGFRLDPLKLDNFRSKQTAQLIFRMGGLGPEASRMRLSYTDREGAHQTLNFVARYERGMVLVEEDPEPPTGERTYVAREAG